MAFSSLTYDTFAKFLSGQFLEALILGGLFLLFMLVLRIPYALLIAILIAITALLPVFGAFVGAAVGFVLIFSLNPTKAILFLVISFVLQQVEGDVIYPKVAVEETKVIVSLEDESGNAFAVVEFLKR